MRMRPSTLIAILGPAALLGLLLAVSFGSGAVGPREVLALLDGSADDTIRQVVLELRLPRALAAFGTGAALALAGALMQVLLRNPLADPYILGTSGGAAAFTLAAMLAGASGMFVDAAALAGALASTLLVFALARRGQWTPERLLLTGVVVAAGWSALVSLLLAVAPERNLRGALFWLMGDFAFADDARACLLIAAAGTIGCFALGRALNVLAAGDQQAALLGLPVRGMRIGIYFLTAILTAAAVTTAGTVGFVGLVVPHLVRLLAGADHRIVVPGAALAGGTLLVLADMVARTVLAPRQLPVGAITALVGVPLFLFLLERSQRATI
ncbi:MAG: iron ABC transporter permease [Gammaproteobacteria bacterium]|nr:iron ABC transporter permease [Gammaproteobacteria bacterium]